jgi:hypothetical protein
MTAFADQLYQFGSVPVGLPIYGLGKSYFVRPSTGSDDYKGNKPTRAFKTLAKALTAVEYGDTVYLIAESNSASGTTDYQSTGLDWNVDGVNLIGIGANPFIGSRARIAQLSTVVDIEDLVTVSADNCVIANIAVFQGVADSSATAERAMVVSGERNHIINCQIQGIGHADMDSAGARSLAVEGSENTFTNCFIGLDTIIRSTATTEVDCGNGRNMFDKCHIHSHTDLTTFKALTTTSIATGRYVMLRDCMLSVITNITGVDTITGAIAHAVPGTVYLLNSFVAGYSNVSTADNANIFVGAGVGNAVDAGLAGSVDIA